MYIPEDKTHRSGHTQHTQHIGTALTLKGAWGRRFGKDVCVGVDSNVSDICFFQLSMRELREAQAKVKAAKKFVSEWKNDTMGTSTVRAEKKRLEEQLKKVKLEVKKEAA
jgi:hypothetical protein